MKIYTRRGDAGETDLFGGTRVAKDDLRVEVYGAVDELNANLGVAAKVSGRSEYMNVKACSYLTSSISESVSRCSSSVSPQKPAMMSVERARSGTIERARPINSRY